MSNKVNRKLLFLGLFVSFWLKGPISDWPLEITQYGWLVTSTSHALFRSVFTVLFTDEVERGFRVLEISPSTTFRMLSEMFLFVGWTHFFGNIMWTIIVVCLTEVPAACKYIINILILTFFSNVLLNAFYDIDRSQIRTRSDGCYVWLFDEAMYQATSTVRHIVKRWKILIPLVQKHWKTMIPLIKKPLPRRIEELRKNLPDGRALTYRSPIAKVAISPLVRCSRGKLAKQCVEQWKQKGGQHV